MRSPFGNKIHRQFWNLKTTAVCFRIKSKYKQQNNFSAFILFLHSTKMLEWKNVRRPLFLGRRQNPHKVGETDDLSEWWQFTPKIMRQVLPKFSAMCCQKAFLAVCIFFIFFLHRFSSAPSRVQLVEKMEVPLARTSWSTPGIGCNLLIWFDFNNLDMNWIVNNQSKSIHLAELK